MCVAASESVLLLSRARCSISLPLVLSYTLKPLLLSTSNKRHPFLEPKTIPPIEAMASRRMSLMSVATEATGTSRPVGAGTLTSNSVMSSLNQAYNQSRAYQLDAGTSLVVNTWATATSASGPTVDAVLADKAVQHAIRRAEDGCIVLT